MLSQLSYAPIRLPATRILYHKVLCLSIPFLKFFYFFLLFFFALILSRLLTCFGFFFHQNMERQHQCASQKRMETVPVANIDIFSKPWYTIRTNADGLKREKVKRL